MKVENTICFSLILIYFSVFPLCVKDGNALHLAMFIFYAIFLYPNFSKLAPLQVWFLFGFCVLMISAIVSSGFIIFSILKYKFKCLPRSSLMKHLPLNGDKANVLRKEMPILHTLFVLKRRIDIAE